MTKSIYDLILLEVTSFSDFLKMVEFLFSFSYKRSESEGGREAQSKMNRPVKSISIFGFEIQQFNKYIY